MTLFLVHHGDAVGPEIDPQRPLSAVGRANVDRRACNALAELSATRDLQPDDPPQWIQERLRSETRDILIAGHFPHLPRLRALLSGGGEDDFPPHGVVALVTADSGETWQEVWRLV